MTLDCIKVVIDHNFIITTEATYDELWQWCCYEWSSWIHACHVHSTGLCMFGYSSVHSDVLVMHTPVHV